jgi:hypothetical protein
MPGRVLLRGAPAQLRPAAPRCLQEPPTFCTAHGWSVTHDISVISLLLTVAVRRSQVHVTTAAAASILALLLIVLNMEGCPGCSATWVPL